jgi:hypothetical protein
MKLFICALTAGAMLAVCAVAETDASACGFFNYREVRPVPVARVIPPQERIATADARLDEEKLAAAGAEVVAAFPKVRGLIVGTSPLDTRAVRILSLALVRADGSLPGVWGFSSTAAKDRAANIAWAVGRLRGVDAERHDDPVARADFAEALAKSPGHEDEAFTILADLADRDLIGSAHAYAALAVLRAGRGDAAGTQRALAQCELMTRSPSSVCKAPDTRVASRE